MKFTLMLIALHLVTTTPAAANKGSLRALQIIKENPGDGTIRENPGDFIEKPIINNPGEGEVIGLPPRPIKLSPEKCQPVCHDCKDTVSPNPNDVDECVSVCLATDGTDFECV